MEKIALGCRGEMSLEVTDTATGKVLRRHSARHNDFVAGGLTSMASRMRNNGTKWLRSNSGLRVYTGPTSFIPIGGYNPNSRGDALLWETSTSANQIYLQFRDSSASTYTPTSQGTQVWIASIHVSTFTPPNSWGTKASTETWTWTWTVTFTGAAGTDLSWSGSLGSVVRSALSGNNTPSPNIFLWEDSGGSTKSQMSGVTATNAGAILTMAASRSFSAADDIFGIDFTLGASGGNPAFIFLTRTTDFSMADGQDLNVTLNLTFADA